MNTEAFLPVFGRLLLAAVLGGALGMEREFSHKAAGLRTNMLIALGSALFTFVAAALLPDAAAERSRVIAGVITGVGFLGGGAILRIGPHVRGLTTAATIWVVTGVGMASALGQYALAVGATSLALFILSVMERLEMYVARRGGTNAQDPTDPSA